MANRQIERGAGVGDRAARGGINDSTIALTESQIVELEVAEPPPAPGPRGARTARRAAVPNEASLWPGAIVGADEFLPAAPARRSVGLWVLSGAAAAAAVMAGILYGPSLWASQLGDAMPLRDALSAMPPVAAVQPTPVAVQPPVAVPPPPVAVQPTPGVAEPTPVAVQPPPVVAEPTVAVQPTPATVPPTPSLRHTTSKPATASKRAATRASASKTSTVSKKSTSRAKTKSTSTSKATSTSKRHKQLTPRERARAGRR